MLPAIQVMVVTSAAVGRSTMGSGRVTGEYPRAMIGDEAASRVALGGLYGSESAARTLPSSGCRRTTQGAARIIARETNTIFWRNGWVSASRIAIRPSKPRPRLAEAIEPETWERESNQDKIMIFFGDG